MVRNLKTPKGEGWGGEERDEKEEEEEAAAAEELEGEVAEITVSRLTVFFSRLNVLRSHRGFPSATSSSAVGFAWVLFHLPQRRDFIFTFLARA